jgi:hypothetical protein
MFRRRGFGKRAHVRRWRTGRAANGSAMFVDGATGLAR